MPASFQSTRGYHGDESFLDTVRIGLAPDGGLFVPTHFETFANGELASLQRKPFIDIVATTLAKFPLEGLSVDRLKELLQAAYGDNFSDPAVAPVRQLRDGQHLLELFHGPTAAFKDLALQLTPRFFAEATAGRDEKYCILAATSGDTGVATMAGYGQIDGVRVLVLYPRGGVSPVQERQMLASQSDLVRCAAVDADFDFCQSTIKQLFADRTFAAELDNTKLSSANSINWGRLLPQVGYWVSAYLQLAQQKKISIGDPVDVVVPCGNFGNILAAYYAKQLGVPFEKFMVASNENNILTDFIQTGAMDIRDRKLQLTTSPSIDILRSSNTERMLYLLAGGNANRVADAQENLATEGVFTLTAAEKEKLQSEFLAGWCSESECFEAIKEVFEKDNYLLDTHTAVAMKVADEHKSDRPQLIASTAHWAKFPTPVLTAIGGDPAGKSMEELYAEIAQRSPTPAIHPRLAEIVTAMPREAIQLPADIAAIKATIKEFMA